MASGPDTPGSSPAAPVAAKASAPSRWGTLLLLVGCVVVAWIWWFGRPLTVVLIRHAEKATQPPDDPPLSADGTARAQELVNVLGDAGVDAIFVTSLIRTGLTAGPLAASEGLTPVTLAISENAPQPYVTELIDQLRSGHWGETVLVVSHSHTVPMIADQLGAPATGSLGNEFDNLFTITVPRFGSEVTIVRARYGAPN